MAVDDRVKKLKEIKLCFNCFLKDHLKPQCKVVPTCATYNRKHHTLMHGRSIPPTALSVNSATFHPGKHHQFSRYRRVNNFNNQHANNNSNNNSNSNFQAQQQQFQLLQPQQLAPQGQIITSESAYSAHNDLAGLVLTPPAAPAAGGEVPLSQ